MEEKAGDAGITRYMQQDAYPIGGGLVAANEASPGEVDCHQQHIQLSVVESPTFRSFCQALNGRFPSYSRKAITNEVSTI